ncbi:MAG: 50S ribosome-binding GTPase [Deltaproteobacteria bacterium]|nr:50S ribosome-binding GTPase [Deltaproteobacteria bacterium]
MKDPARKLRDNLTYIQNVLKDGVFYTLTHEQIENLLIESGNLVEKLDSITQSSLVVGLLGGTGVGKSSIMNALAGLEIAETSHRRPHTDSILIYRHVQTPLPADLPMSGIPWREYTHAADSIQQILLCDLPDFDSLVDEHRKNVMDFLQYLDVLVWVTSPEKYADGRFYEFLRLVPKAHQNFYFVLNKVDILFEGKGIDGGFEELSKVHSSLQKYLKKNGVENPLIYMLSAREPLQKDSLAHWNQFSTFRYQIFQQRKFKEIKDIKTANLDQEMMQLLVSFERELINLEVIQKSVEHSCAELKTDSGELNQAFHTSMALWMETDQIKSEMIVRMNNLSLLVGPAIGFAFLHDGLKGLIKSREDRDTANLATLIEEISTVFQRQLNRIKNRLSIHILRRGVPSSVTGKIENMVGSADKAEDIHKKVNNIISTRTASHKNPAVVFKALQYGAYLFLFLLLVFAMAGEEVWRKFFAQPGLTTLINFLLASLYTLFTPRGLAAVASYALINIFFGYRFYVHYRKMLEKRAEKAIASLQTELNVLWEEELDRVHDELIRTSNELKDTIKTLKTLKSRS